MQANIEETGRQTKPQGLGTDKFHQYEQKRKRRKRINRYLCNDIFMIISHKPPRPGAQFRFSLRGSLATTVWDLETLLELARRIHKTPFIFPLLAGLVVLNLPRFIESLEPVPVSIYISC